jgi:hypothetical protein
VSGDDVSPGAAELAERILDEVTRPNQNWCNIAVLARELAALADAAARLRGRGPRPEDC